MTCEEAKPLIGAYHDGELTDVVHVLEIERHLEGCAPCASRLESLSRLGRNVREKALYHDAPSGLRRRVASAMRAEVRRSHPSNWRTPALALGTALALAASFTLVLFPRGNDRLATGLVEDHIRSLQADHLFDVASSSRHTVKPWFQGRVDFSPKVPDLTNEGFPLLGGRLDYLGGKPCVAIVYRRFKHVVNVFAFRRTDAGEGPRETEGYHLAHWRIHELEYWAVSDLNPVELRTFAREFVSAAGD